MIELLFRIADRLPKWALPAFAGAVLVGGIVSFRVLLVLPAAFSEPGAVVEALRVVAAAAGGGAAGGLVYSLIGKPLVRIPGIGPYLTGIVTVAGYMGALAVVLPYVDDEAPRFFDSAAGVFSYILCVLFFGAVMGRSWFSGPDSLAADLPTQSRPQQSRAELSRARAEFRRARIERRRSAKAAAEQSAAADTGRE